MPILPSSPGEPYPGVRAEYSFRGGDHELRISLDDDKLSDDELSGVTQAISAGPVEFGMYPETRKGLLFIARFGAWLSLPCFYHFRREAQATGDHTPPLDPRRLPPGSCDRLRIVLVDADTGEEERPREVPFTLEFTRKIRRAIAGQAAGAYDEGDYDRWVASVERRAIDVLWRPCETCPCET